MGYKFEVVKLSDIDSLLNELDRNQFYKLLNTINGRRELAGKKYNRYLVINQDEPYAPAVLNLMKQHGHWEDDHLELHAKNSISVLCELAHQNAIDKGWYEEPKSFGELIALMHSELSETLEEHRNGFHPQFIYTEEGKPCGIPIELADVVIRVFDACGYFGIDLEEAIRLKMEYNKTRSHRHGGKML